MQKEISQNRFYRPMKPSSLATVVVLGVLGAVAPTACAATPIRLEGANMATPRAGHQATLMTDGRVLVTGGCAGAGCVQVQRSSELYDPVRNRFGATESMLEARVSHTATVLPDGRVLVTGGWTGASATASTEIFDPLTGRFASGPDMSVPRMDGTATLLDTGEVLIAGGASQTNRPTTAAERFNPTTGKITATGALQTARVHHTAVKLRDGRVLVVGGLVSRNTATATAEIYDPKTGKFRPTGALNQPRCKHAALLLADGRVMVLAGSPDGGDRPKLATTEIFDPTTETFVQGPSLMNPRYKIASAAVGLENGAVMIAGDSKDVEVWIPGSPRFVRARQHLGADLAFSTATSLKNGRVLVIGGYDRTITPTARTWLISTLTRRER